MDFLYLDLNMNLSRVRVVLGFIFSTLDLDSFYMRIDNSWIVIRCVKILPSISMCNIMLVLNF